MAGQVALTFGAQRLLAVLQQIADIEQLQQPPPRLIQQPATGMQGGATGRLEIQIQGVGLPVQEIAFKHKQTVGLHVIVQSRFVVLRQGQRRTQRAGNAQYLGTIVEP
ncbi:hypothetical protein D3C77_539230 [compost metagenome]